MSVDQVQPSWRPARKGGNTMFGSVLKIHLRDYVCSSFSALVGICVRGGCALAVQDFFTRCQHARQPKYIVDLDVPRCSMSVSFLPMSV